jgi:hypothetical protein
MKSFWGSFLAFFWGVFYFFRLYEEGSQPKTTSTKTTTSTSTTKTSQSHPAPQGPFIRIWPGSHEDAGVLILSDSDSDDSYESNEN